MKTKDQIQWTLFEALGAAIVSPETTPFMSNTSEALALQRLCLEINSEVSLGTCKVTRLMCLCQQALRAATCGMHQSVEREATVDSLIERTVGKFDEN
jgi:hypothetical protein